MTPGQHAKSALSLAVITTNLVFWLALAFPLALLRLVLPFLRRPIHRLLEGIYRGAVRVDDFWLRRVMGHAWSLPSLPLDPRRPCIVVSNHVSWSDIFPIQSLLVRNGFVVQFLSKRELLVLPVVGLILWAFEFPLLRRAREHGGDEAAARRRDFEALREACRGAREHPVALVSFAEGTRATAARRAERQSPYRHLLPPRAGGFGALCDGLGDALAGVVDCTLVYARGEREVTFWEFLAGSPARVEVQADWIEASAIPAEREARARFLAERWARKDEWIDAFAAPTRSPVDPKSAQNPASAALRRYDRQA
jgi:1-acyl-sn-glycerol-3-phosphate acyltransferase